MKIMGRYVRVSVLEAKGIKKRFGGVVALRNGNIKCEAGRITGLIGANGSGKSTISKIICGVYKADEGEILFNGKNVKFRNPNEASKAGIAMAFQNLSLLEDLTVWQNIHLGIERNKGIFVDNEFSIAAAKKIMEELVHGFDVKRKIYQLNAGEQQLVEIAKAIATEPKLLILDEPTAALEQFEVKALFTCLRRLAARGAAIIFTSHRLGELTDICDDVFVFRNGENVGYIDFEKEEKNTDRIVTLLTGENVDLEIRKEYRQIPDDYILAVDGLHYGTVLHDISFKVRKGEVLGIGGLAGQGQNELMMALAGFYKETRANAEMLGRTIGLNKPKNTVRSGIYLVPGDRQKEGLFLKDSVYTNVIFAKLGLRSQPMFTPRKKYRAESKKIVDMLSIVTESIDTPVANLSGGNQQKVVVGKWLPFKINLLLLADPAKGVDIAAKKDMYDFIMRQVREQNMSVILYASDNTELISYCDRLLIMYEGTVVQELAGAEITDTNIMNASIHVKEGK